MEGAWFVGVDLAWGERRASGVAVLRGEAGRLQFVSAGTAHTTDEIASAIRGLPGPRVIAIDAPLVVQNPTGMRLCDRRVTQIYGRFHAGTYPANLQILKGRVRAMELARLLGATVLYRANDLRAVGQDERGWAIEVYPHAGMVDLFGLDRTVKYKRGPVRFRQAGLATLAALFRERLPHLDPPLPITAALESFLAVDPCTLRGGALKAHEDRLDALFCAYLAAHVARWGERRNCAMGEASSGTIVVPQVRWGAAVGWVGAPLVTEVACARAGAPAGGSAGGVERTGSVPRWSQEDSGGPQRSGLDPIARGRPFSTH